MVQFCQLTLTILKELVLHMAPLIDAIQNFAPGFDEQSANSHTSCPCVTGKIILGILHDTFCVCHKMFVNTHKSKKFGVLDHSSHDRVRGACMVRISFKKTRSSEN